MRELIRVAAELQSLFHESEWRFCFIGGLALQRWGQPRETIDVDVTLLTGAGGEGPYIEEQLRPLVELKEEPEILSMLRKTRREGES